MTSYEISLSLCKSLKRKVRAAEINELAQQIGVPTTVTANGKSRIYDWSEKNIEKVKQLLITS